MQLGREISEERENNKVNLWNTMMGGNVTNHKLTSQIINFLYLMRVGNYKMLDAERKAHSYIK